MKRGILIKLMILISIIVNGQTHNSDVDITGDVIIGKIGQSGNLKIRRGTDNSTVGSIGFLGGGTESNNLSISSNSGGGFISFRTNYGGGVNERIRITNNGFLGIGTETPTKPLEIVGTNNTLKIWKGSGNAPIEIYSDGDGSHNNSSVSLYSYGYGGVEDFTSFIRNWNGSFYYKFGATDGSHNALRITKGGGGGSGLNTGFGILDVYTTNQAIGIRFNGNGASYINTGNVGIGTSTPTEKLSVNGTIRSKEVKIEASPWPDYVFDPNYELLSLTETKKYIKANKHLPEVPSATEMEKNGVALGEMNRLLLKKIEELTLHQIELQENFELLQLEVISLKSGK